MEKTTINRTKGLTQVNECANSLQKNIIGLSLTFSKHVEYNMHLFFDSLKKKDFNKIVKLMKKNSITITCSFENNVVKFINSNNLKKVFETTLVNFMNGQHEY
jgi:hypothetical protein